MQQKNRLRPVVGLRLVLRTAFVEQDGLGGELASRGECDSAVRQVVRAHVVTGGNGVIGQLCHRLRGGIVGINVPIRLRDIGVRFFRIQRQTQRKYDRGAVGRHIEIAHSTHALGDRAGDVDFGAPGAGLTADVKVATRNGSDEIANVDVLGEDRSLDVCQGEIGHPGGQRLSAGNARRVTGGGAFASQYEKQRQRDCRELQQTVTVFTRCESDHKWLPILMVSVQRSTSTRATGIIELNRSHAHIFVRCSYAYC